MTASTIPKRDRFWVFASIAVLTALAWTYTVYLGLQNTLMPKFMAWSAIDFLFMFVMWAVMMFAMMLPAVTPAVMVFGRVQAKRSVSGRPSVIILAFVTGYLIVWAGFSLIATLGNWALHASGALTGMMGKVGPQAGGALLVAAGIFQWTQAKSACLEHCRSPIGFLTQNWREGKTGAVLMGLAHGGYCLGCCWLLMLLLFVFGVMNLTWVAVLALVVLAEKTLPFGRQISRFFGAVFLISGLVLIVGWVPSGI